jgi:hypothetical protein
MPDINEICRTAWDSTKKEHQPAYDTLEQSYKEMLINRANLAASGRVIDEGPFKEFDTRVAVQCEVPDDAAADVAETVDEVPPEVKEELVEEAVAEEASPEPKEHVEPKGPLPKDFPKHDLLHEAGINTYGQLCKVEDLTTIEGIGPETAKKIAKRVKADERALNKWSNKLGD